MYHQELTGSWYIPVGTETEQTPAARHSHLQRDLATGMVSGPHSPLASLCAEEDTRIAELVC